MNTSINPSVLSEFSLECQRAEALKLAAEARKLEAEAEEINKRLKSWHFEILAKPLLTAIISAVVAGLVTWKFGLDAAKSLNDLNEKSRIAIAEDLKTTQLKHADAEKKLAEAQKSFADAEKKRLDADRNVDSLRLQLGRLQASTNNVATKSAIEETAYNLAANQQATVGPSEPWFAVVASTYSKEEAKEFVIKFSNPVQSVEIFNATDDKGKPVYAVTLGGKLRKDDAVRVVKEAKLNKLAADAFAWHSSRWTKTEF